MLALSALTFAQAQPDYIPQSLILTVYSEGTTKAEYHVASEPDLVRVEVPLFGPPFTNLVIRDEEGNPLSSSTLNANVTVDSIGASELYFTYLTGNLTTSDGSMWSVDVASPVETIIILPRGAAFFDMSDIPTEVGTMGDKQYLRFQPGDISIYYLMGMPDVAEEAENSITNAESYLNEKESEGYILTGARDILDQAKALYGSEQFLESKNNADDALEIASDTIEYADSAATELENAVDAMNMAKSERRIEGLSTAEASLESAYTFYEAGSYRKAEVAALQAYEQALTANEPKGISMYYIDIFAALCIIAVSGFYLAKRGIIAGTRP